MDGKSSIDSRRDPLVHISTPRHEIIVAPVTRTIRGLRTEVLLTEEDGMPAACAVNFDHLLVGAAGSLRFCVVCPLRAALA